MEHRPFPKIPTTLDDPGGGPAWVATEKIHGAQLVVATDGDTLRIGKRKAWLESDDAFFGWQMLRAQLDRAVRQLHAELSRGGELHVYGELFGGRYPHPDVPALPGLSPVQTGVWYSPTLVWAPFDALWCADGDAVFLAHHTLEQLCDSVQLPTPPCLGRGTRNELTRLPVRYPSEVPGRLGLPPLPDNVAEGFVLKPDAELTAKGRPVIKHKIPEFSDNRFDQSLPFDADAHLSVEQLLRLTDSMMGPMRAASARSKVGEEPSAVVDEMVLDVWIDLEAMFPRCMASLAGEPADRFRDELTAQARAQVGE